MASTRNARLKRLPHRDDTWQVDVRQAGSRWISAIVSEADEEVVAITGSDRRPAIRAIWDLLTRTMLDPDDGYPSRPAQIEVRAGRLRGLRPMLNSVDIELVLADELDLIDDLFAQLTEDEGEDYDRCLLDMPGVTPPAVRSLFQAAAAFYRKAPWKQAGVVQVDRPACSPWYAALTGRGGTTPGLVLSEDLEAANQVRRGELSDRKARTAFVLALLFGSKRQLVDSDLEMIQQYKLPIAGPRAYPMVFCQEPGERLRPLFDSEVQFLDACLRALPRFLGRRKGADQFETQVALATGAVPLGLSRVAD
jgi:hypothetical protein